MTAMRGSKGRSLAVMRAVLALAALLAAPYRSWGEPGDAKATPAADAVGRAHFQRGQRLSASGQYAAAYREFEAGYEATGRPLFLFNMAEAARASGDAARAREAYLEFLRVDPKSALAATARARLADLEAGARQDASAARPDGPAHPEAAARPDAVRPDAAPPAPSATPPSVTARPGSARPETLPLVPPSAVEAQANPRPDSLPPNRFAADRADTGEHPVWKTWPFWAVVGGVVAGGAIVFAVTRDGGSACGTGCSELNLR